jgi:ABC-type transport system substrate-binding protein
VIPLLPKGTFVNWLAWTSQVSTPDPRSGLYRAFHSKGSENFQKVNNPELDNLTATALATVDDKKAKDLVNQIQKVVLENGHYGNVMLYNYISRTAVWNYLHGNYKTQPAAGKPGNGWALFAGHLNGGVVWLDPADPSYNQAIKSRSIA